MDTTTNTLKPVGIFEGNVDDLTFDADNAIIHTDKNRELIRKSVTELGMGRSILVDEAGKVLAGNGTLREAKAAGKTRVLVVDADADTIVAVRRSDLSPLDKTRMALLDNKASDAHKWNEKVLRKLATDAPEQKLLEGIFDARDLERIYKAQEVAQPLAGGGADEDVEPELAVADAQAVTAPGSHVKMVQLFMTIDTQPLFIARIKELAARFGTKTITETVDEAVRQLHATLCAPPQA